MSTTACNTPHPDFPLVVCQINKGDHRDAKHRVTTERGSVEWPMEGPDWVDYVPKAQMEAAVHEAYVNAQRAVTEIKFCDRSAMYRLGQEHMQEDAVRAIRTAAEEARNG